MARRTGSVEQYKTNPDRWRIRANYVDPTGRRRRVPRVIEAPHTKAGRRVAEKALDELLDELERTDPGSGSATFDAVADRFLEWVRANRAGNTFLYYDRYLGYLRPSLGELELRRVTPYAIEEAYSTARSAGRSDYQLRAMHKSLKRCLGMAKRWRLVSENAAAEVEAPRHRSAEVEPPAPASIGAAMEKLEARDQALAVYLRLAANIGARREELLALRWRDVDLEARTVTVSHAIAKNADGDYVDQQTKTGAESTKTIGAKTAGALEAWRARRLETCEAVGLELEPDGYIFARARQLADDPAGRRLPNPNSLSQRWRGVRGEVGLAGVKLKDVRHMVATTMLDAGYSVADVAARLDHASPTVTLEVYAKSIRARDGEAAEELDRLL